MVDFIEREQQIDKYSKGHEIETDEEVREFARKWGRKNEKIRKNIISSGVKLSASDNYLTHTMMSETDNELKESFQDEASVQCLFWEQQQKESVTTRKH